MTSPAKRHFERVTAASTAASAGPTQSLKGASRYELMLAKLAADRRRLKSFQSVARKVDVKREVLPEYAAYIDGALEGGRGAQDDVLTTIMIWRIDAGDYAGALHIARYAIRHNMTLPEQYERKLPAAVAEEFAEAALAALRNGEGFDARQLAEVAELTEKTDMHDPIRAKLHKAIGLASIPADVTAGSAATGVDRARTEFALNNLRRALTLDVRSGVKANIARLETSLSDAGAQKATRK